MNQKTNKEARRQEQIKRKFFTPCQTRDEFSKWIQFFLKLYLPDQTVSRHADTNPLDAAWQVYDICVNKNNPNNIQELLYVGGRGSGKTLDMAIVEFMVAIHDKRDIVHVGAVLAQAKRCYYYINKFMLDATIRKILEDDDVATDERILQKMNMEKSIFNFAGKEVTIEVLPLTLKACLTDGTKIKLADGSMKLIENVVKGDLIESVNNYVEVVDNYQDIAECLEVELDDGRIIRGTLDHRVMTTRGLVSLQDLQDEDEIL